MIWPLGHLKGCPNKLLKVVKYYQSYKRKFEALKH
jgi:hypothetical protein